MHAIQRPVGDVEHEGLTTVLGPCPGCDNWQLEYTDRVRKSYANWTVERTDMYFPGEDRPMKFAGAANVDESAFYAAVEEALQEHMAECPHLRDLVENY